MRPAFGKLCGRIRDAAKDDGDAREKAVPVGEHEVQRVVIRYNDGFEGYPGVFLGKQAYEFVIQTSGRMAFIVEIFAMQAYTEARFRIFKLFRDPPYDVVFPEMAGMKRIDDQNFAGGKGAVRSATSAKAIACAAKMAQNRQIPLARAASGFTVNLQRRVYFL